MGVVVDVRRVLNTELIRVVCKVSFDSYERPSVCPSEYRCGDCHTDGKNQSDPDIANLIGPHGGEGIAERPEPVALESLRLFLLSHILTSHIS